MTTFVPGQVVRGKYRIERILGQGGMGVVVAGRHIALDQRVAIKFLLPAMLEKPEIVERFAREARAASKIQSDYVARVIDVDTLENGAPFMVMEFLEGSNLSSVRKQARPLPVAVAAAYVLDACDAIGEAHALGIVHRDIKPANLFLTRLGGGKTRVKVLDFGISKMAADGSEPSVTGTGAVMGSAEYMSPEQMKSLRDVDVRTDIWALGVTLYELVTGRMPFRGETITQVCWSVITDVPAPPSTIASEVPAAFDTVVLRCLEKDRTRRYGSVAELAEALAHFAALPLPQRSPDARASYDRLSAGFGSAPALGTGPLPSDGHPVAAASSSPSFGTVYVPSLGTNAAMSNSSASGPTRATRTSIFIAAAIAAALLIVGGAFFLKHFRGAATADAATSSAPSRSGDIIPAASAPTGPAPTVAPAVATGAASSTAAAPSGPVAMPPSEGMPAKPVGSRIERPGTATPPSHPPPTNQDRCNPPYTTDANGDKHAKPGCK